MGALALAIYYAIDYGGPKQRRMRNGVEVLFLTKGRVERLRYPSITSPNGDDAPLQKLSNEKAPNVFMSLPTGHVRGTLWLLGVLLYP